MNASGKYEQSSTTRPIPGGGGGSCGPAGIGCGGIPGGCIPGGCIPGCIPGCGGIPWGGMPGCGVPWGADGNPPDGGA
ncbi:hypothetical protein GCM10023222_02400 [Saccharopolyspora cebuensis]